MVEFRLEDKILELVYYKYILKFRRKRINKVIKEKCESEYEVRRSLKNELKELKEKLLTESDGKKIMEIQKRIAEILYELNQIEEEIKKKASIEIETKEKINTKLREIERELEKKFKAIINEEKDIKDPIKKAINNKNPDLAVLVILDEAMRVDKPEPVLLVSSSNSSKVPGDGTGGAEGVRKH